METYSTHQDRNDCVVRALANGAGMTYTEAFQLCRMAGRRKGDGMLIEKWLPLFEKHMSLDESVYLAKSFKTVKTLSRKLKSRGGTYLVLVRGHVAVYRDGEWLDWIDSTRCHRIRRVWEII